MLGILDRYVLREIVATWIGVTGVLLLILLSNKFSRFLGDVASGGLPKEALISLMAYASINYLVILIPIGLFLAILLSLGRMYQDSEMSALKACGVGPWQIYRPVIVVTSVICFALYWMSMQASPWAARQSLELTNTAIAQAQLTNLEPGKFLTADQGGMVFYANAKNAQGELLDVFLQQSDKNSKSEIQQLVTADLGYHADVNAKGQKIFILKNGVRYQGVPGQSDYEIVNFSEHGIPFLFNLDKGKAPGPEELTATELKHQSGLEFLAETQWRWSVPISAFLLALLALPLSKTNPRQGRFGKVAIAILLYIVYANLMALAKAWIAKEKVDPALGIWWVHAIILTLTAFLLIQQYGFRGLFFGGHRRLSKTQNLSSDKVSAS